MSLLTVRYGSSGFGGAAILAVPLFFASMALAQPAHRETDAEAAARVIGGLPNYQNARVYCMDGTQAADDRNSRNTAEYCMRIIEQSADYDRSGRNDRPDHGILAPYVFIMGNHGYIPGVTNPPIDVYGSAFRRYDHYALAALNTLRHASLLPEARTTIGPGHFLAKDKDGVAIPGGDGHGLGLVPGVAWDAGFSASALDAKDGAPVAAPSENRSELIDAAARCFTNAGETIGNCYLLGVEHFRRYHHDIGQR